MISQKNGFTLIELVAVIIIISILAGIALPRFINQTATASQNSTTSLAAALSAVSAENYAKRSANSALGSGITNCTQIGTLLQNGLPSGYTITSLVISSGAAATCTLKGLNSTTANFVGLGIT